MADKCPKCGNFTVGFLGGCSVCDETERLHDENIEAAGRTAEASRTAAAANLRAGAATLRAEEKRQDFEKRNTDEVCPECKKVAKGTHKKCLGCGIDLQKRCVCGVSNFISWKVCYSCNRSEKEIEELSNKKTSHDKKISKVLTALKTDEFESALENYEKVGSESTEVSYWGQPALVCFLIVLGAIFAASLFFSSDLHLLFKIVIYTVVFVVGGIIGLFVADSLHENMKKQAVEKNLVKSEKYQTVAKGILHKEIGKVFGTALRQKELEGIAGKILQKKGQAPAIWYDSLLFAELDD